MNKNILYSSFHMTEGVPTAYRARAKSGCMNHNESVLWAGAKAKSVTRPLIIPSVLYLGFYLLS